MTAASWWKQLRQTAAFLAAAAVLGWALGEALAAVAGAALALLAYWMFQMRRAFQWMRDADGEPPAAQGLWGEFFHSLHHAQRRDREERDRLQTAVSYMRDSFAALKDATVLIDPAGHIEWCNEAAQTHLGLRYPRDRGQAIADALAISGFAEYFRKGDYGEPFHARSPARGGMRLKIEVTPFGGGSRLLFARDVTREAKLEQMRRDFVANVSHELRTPLTVITGYLHTLLESGADSPAGQRALEQMRQQAARMETLLRDLLWLSQIEATEGLEDFADDVDMADVLAEVAQAMGAAHPERKLAIDLRSGRALRGNYKQLYSAVSNLVVNAMKYSEGDVEVAWTDRGGDSCLSVKDSGPGIEKKHMPRITERFYRVDKGRSREAGGTGLGLAIVKHVLASHGARLEIESEPGQGSTFRCVFPMPPAPRPDSGGAQ